MRGTEFLKAYPPLGLEFIPEAQVTIDSLVLHGLSQPVFVDTLVGEGGLPYVARRGVHLRKKRQKTDQYWQEKWQEAMPHQVSELDFHAQRLLCLHKCLTDREKELVQLFFRGLEAMTSHQKITSQSEKDKINAAATELLSLDFGVQNIEVALLIEAVWNDYLLHLLKLKAEEKRGREIMKLTDLMVAAVLGDCRAKGFVSPHYQVSHLKFERMKLDVSAILATHEARLNKDYLLSSALQIKSSFNKVNLEIINTVLNILGITQDSGDGGVGILMPSLEK